MTAVTQSNIQPSSTLIGSLIGEQSTVDIRHGSVHQELISLKTLVPQRTSVDETMDAFEARLTPKQKGALEQVKEMLSQYQEKYRHHSGFSEDEMECESHLKYLTKPGGPWDIVLMRDQEQNVVGGMHVNVVAGSLFTSTAEKTVHVEQFWADRSLTVDRQKGILADIFDRIQTIVDQSGKPVVLEMKESQIESLPITAKLINFPIEQCSFDSPEGNSVKGLAYGVIMPNTRKAQTIQAQHLAGYLQNYQDWAAPEDKDMAMMLAELQTRKTIGLVTPASYIENRGIASNRDNFLKSTGIKLDVDTEALPYTVREVSMVSLRDIYAQDKALANSLFAEYYDGFSRAFPDPDERESKNDCRYYFQHKSTDNMDLKLIVADGKVVGGAHLMMLDGLNWKFGMGVYLWVDEELRGKGIGSKAYTEVTNEMKRQGAACIVGEMNDPHLMSIKERAFDLEAGMTPERRKAFWSNKGLRTLDVFYGQPALSADSSPVEYLQMIVQPFDDRVKGSISRDEYIAIVHAFFSTFVDSVETNPTFRKIVEATKDMEIIEIVPLDQKRSFIEKPAYERAKEFKRNGYQLDALGTQIHFAFTGDHRNPVNISIPGQDPLILDRLTGGGFHLDGVYKIVLSSDGKEVGLQSYWDTERKGSYTDYLILKQDENGNIEIKRYTTDCVGVGTQKSFKCDGIGELADGKLGLVNRK